MTPVQHHSRILVKEMENKLYDLWKIQQPEYQLFMDEEYEVIKAALEMLKLKLA